ncbi:Serine/threonine-protein kinase ppk25 [Lamellibrachia satsuma]|nr:Serine/threonine-protein kinase ppk25 [Lamellibrachia satsuma]
MENVMLDEKKKNIKLIDFGLSNVYKESNPLCTHCGSLEYAAPELFLVGKAYGPEIDIWSLITLYYRYSTKPRKGCKVNPCRSSL